MRQFELDVNSDNCWGWGLCHPLLTSRDPNSCKHCPGPNPNTWAQQKDLQFSVRCQDSSAKVHFNLERMEEAGWLKDFIVSLEYSENVDMSQAKTKLINDYQQKYVLIHKIFSNYKFCLKLKRNNEVKQFCEVGFLIAHVYDHFFFSAMQRCLCHWIYIR